MIGDWVLVIATAALLITVLALLIVAVFRLTRTPDDPFGDD